jgi:hypothetical protein
MGDRHALVMQVCFPQAFKTARADEAVFERYRPDPAAADGTAGVHIKPPFMDFRYLIHIIYSCSMGKTTVFPQKNQNFTFL